jgi:nucleoside-diphosphate-sugar epimerase
MSEERLVLVTGGTGFIGAYLVRQLVAAGVRVRVLARRPAALDPALRGLVETVCGDVRDPGAIDRAVPGAHTVLHLAACARAWSRDPDEFTSVNVRAVESLLDAATRAGVERLVHVSTVLTLPPFQPAPVNGAASRPTPYELTKRAGERLVESYAAQGRHAVIVHPTRVYGPGPLTDANAVSKVVSLYLSGRFRVRLADRDVLANYVHAADVATGIRLAAERGRAGAHYLLGGENRSFRDFLALVGELGGVRRRVMALPMPAALGVAHVAEWWGRLGGAAPLTPGWVRVFLEDRRGDIGPAQADLGYAPRPLRTGLTETIAWLAQRHRAAA